MGYRYDSQKRFEQLAKVLNNPIWGCNADWCNLVITRDLSPGMEAFIFDDEDGQYSIGIRLDQNVEYEKYTSWDICTHIMGFSELQNAKERQRVADLFNSLTAEMFNKELAE